MNLGSKSILHAFKSYQYEQYDWKPPEPQTSFPMKLGHFILNHMQNPILYQDARQMFHSINIYIIYVLVLVLLKTTTMRKIVWVFVHKIEDSFAKITNYNLSLQIHEISIVEFI